MNSPKKGFYEQATYCLKAALIICLVLFFGCSKTDLGIKNSSALLAIGNGKVISIWDMVPTQNNGLIVGLSSYNKGPDAKVVSLNAAGQIEWDRDLGTDQEDFIQKVWVDKKGNILVVGMTYGMRDTTIKSTRLRENFYLHYMTPDGKTIWEKGIDINKRSNSQLNNKTYDIKEDDLGNFLITALYTGEYIVNQKFEQDYYGALLVVDKSGNLVNRYVQGFNPFYSPFITTPGYGVFFTTETGAGVMEFDKKFGHTPGNIPRPTTETGWPWKNPADPVIAVINSSSSAQTSQFTVVKKEGFVLFDYTHNGVGLTAKELKLSLNTSASYPVAVASGNDKFLFADANGEVFIFNKSWDLINRFKTPWKILRMAILFNGNIAIAFQKEAAVQIMLYNSNGKAIK